MLSWAKAIEFCLWCDRRLAYGERTWEHLRPKAAGGGNDRDNLSVACAACNNDRSLVLGNGKWQRRLMNQTETAISRTRADQLRLLVQWDRFIRRLPDLRAHRAKWVALELRILGRWHGGRDVLLTDAQAEQWRDRVVNLLLWRDIFEAGLTS
jgi:hypothetical protein